MTTTQTSDPLAPCGYCRRCAIHDDPGGCLTVEAFEREHCIQCFAPMNPVEKIMNPVCGKCCRKNHLAVCGG